MNSVDSALPPLNGLALAGGESRRMGQDKAALNYHGRSQIAWLMDLLGPFTEKQFVSVRADQKADPLRSAFPVVVDAAGIPGPIAGLLGAARMEPNAAWLVVACDLPFVTAREIETLLAARKAAFARGERKKAVAFESAFDGLPEPFCTIWEPEALRELATLAKAGGKCPRRILCDPDSVCILPKDEILGSAGSALDNINTPQERQMAALRLKSAAEN